MKWFLMALIFVAGMLQPIQAGMNAALRRNVDHPFQAGAWNMCFGAVLVLLVLTVTRIGLPSWSAIAGAPRWSLFGGVIGATLVISMLIAAPKLGAALMIACFVTGQLSSSLAIDHFGWVGYSIKPATIMRALGVILLLAGVLLIERSSNGS